MLPAILLATAATRPAWAQANTDRQQEVEMALDHYAEAKTPAQRGEVVDYLRGLDRKLVAAAVVDHIAGAQTSQEATAYNGLLEVFKPEGCAAVLDRLGKTDPPAEKGKLIVSLRHCHDEETLRVLAACLDDKRPFPFETHEIRGATPRRLCDVAYDELFLKLRTESRYGLGTGPKMNGLIRERTPLPARDALIAKLKSKLKGRLGPAATPKSS